jgi:hypothetical protein
VEQKIKKISNLVDLDLMKQNGFFSYFGLTKNQRKEKLTRSEREK